LLKIANRTKSQEPRAKRKKIIRVKSQEIKGQERKDLKESQATRNQEPRLRKAWVVNRLTSLITYRLRSPVLTLGS